MMRVAVFAMSLAWLFSAVMAFSSTGLGMARSGRAEGALSPMGLMKRLTVLGVQLSSRLEGLDNPTVWHEFSPLAVKHGAINLGQGFPDWDPPDFVIESMRQATDPQFGRHANQYARSYAHMPLAEILAHDYSIQLGVDLNPATQVATAVGCTNALYCALQGLLSKGDEVILLEPAFDIYMAQVKMAGGTPVFIPLRAAPPGSYTEEEELCANTMFTLDFEELERAITPKTKALILNTPHNPTGKMFTREELTQIANIIKRNPHVIIIADEVYEHIVFDPKTSPHIHMASLPGMFEHTLTLSSSGKTFSATGWKVGWAVGPENLVRAVTSVQQWVNFSAPTPNQDAMALSLEKAREPYKEYPSYYQFLAADYQRKRDLLANALRSAGMRPIIPLGGFFIMADTTSITEFPADQYRNEVTDAMPTNPMPRDWAMSRWMTQEVGVTAIPPSAFYDTQNIHLAQDLLRFAYCKGDETIMEAQRRFEVFFKNPDR